MYDLICFGSVVVDLYFKSNSFKSSEGRFILSSRYRKDVDFFVKAIGGGAVNVAIGTQKLGMKVGLAGALGNNSFTSSVTKFLDNEHIDYSLSEFIDDYNNVSLVLTSDSSERSIINFRSPYTSRYQNVSDVKKLLNTRMLFMANLPNLSLDVRTEILDTAVKNEVITITNIGIADCKHSISVLERYIKLSSIVILNAYEFAELVKKPYKEIDFKINVLNKYFPYAKLLVITDAENGSYAYTPKTMYTRVAVLPKKLVDSNGAGDAYTAGFIAEYFHSQDIEKAMQKGSEYSSQVISRLGAN